MMAEALYSMGEEDAARQEFIDLLEHENSMVREFVLNAIDSVDDESQQIKDAVIAMSKRTEGLQWTRQDHRIVLHLLEEWNIKAEDVGLEIDFFTDFRVSIVWSLKYPEQQRKEYNRFEMGLKLFTDKAESFGHMLFNS